MYYYVVPRPTIPISKIEELTAGSDEKTQHNEVIRNDPDKSEFTIERI